MAAEIIKEIGFDEEKLVALSIPNEKRNWHYQSPLQLKKWLQSNDIKIKALNIYELGPHARRSRLLFMRVFVPDVKVGVIAVHSNDYEPNRWWAYSSGVRHVLGEAIDYIYAKFFLAHPE